MGPRPGLSDGGSRLCFGAPRASPARWVSAASAKGAAADVPMAAQPKTAEIVDMPEATVEPAQVEPARKRGRPRSVKAA